MKLIDVPDNQIVVLRERMDDDEIRETFYRRCVAHDAAVAASRFIHSVGAYRLGLVQGIPGQPPRYRAGSLAKLEPQSLLNKTVDGRIGVLDISQSLFADYLD